MPELPEVETVVRGLRDDVVGRRIKSFVSTWPKQLNGLDPFQVEGRLRGQQIERLHRRAKYIVFTLEHDYLLIHLKMTGRLYVVGDIEDEADRWVRATFGLDDNRTLCFSDSRKFGRIILTTDLEEVLGHLGPEPLEDAFTLGVFRQQLASRSGTLKPLLLNQSFVAGIGNIYADEALWRAGIHPQRKADTLTPAEQQALYNAIRESLQMGIDHEGASVNWYRKPDGSEGTSQSTFNAYGREGEPCPRCGSPIKKIRVAQRGTHFCEHCQH
jgi:formamidopyrimidine-DNA glycosylase